MFLRMRKVPLVIDPYLERGYSESIMLSPKLLTHCPLCNAQYEEKSIRMIGEQGPTRLFHLTCQSCAHAVLAVILENQNGVSSLGMVTDLEAQEAIRFQDADPISADDCLDARDILEKQGKEVCSMFLRGTVS